MIGYAIRAAGRGLVPCAILAATAGSAHAEYPNGSYFTTFGQVDFICRDAGNCVGHYKNGVGRLWLAEPPAKGENGTTWLLFVWIENTDDVVTCDERSPNEGPTSYSWGRAAIRLERGGRSWTGHYGLCDGGYLQEFDGHRAPKAMGSGRP